MDEGTRQTSSGAVEHGESVEWVSVFEEGILGNLALFVNERKLKIHGTIMLSQA
jgi:hypothetical protein